MSIGVVKRGGGIMFLGEDLTGEEGGGGEQTKPD